MAILPNSIMTIILVAGYSSFSAISGHPSRGRRPGSVWEIEMHFSAAASPAAFSAINSGITHRRFSRTVLATVTPAVGIFSKAAYVSRVATKTTAGEDDIRIPAVLKRCRTARSRRESSGQNGSGSLIRSYSVRSVSPVRVVLTLSVRV